MKVLITGKSSRIGNRLEQHLKQAGGYSVEKLSMRGNWEDTDLSVYDAVVHCAAIAHQKEQDGEEDMYMQVNAKMTAQLAEKAKAAGVGCFVFLSTMGVYSEHGDMKRMVTIDKDTREAPNTLYGKSKLEAERLIAPMADDGFRVCLLRPPLVYGKDCRGNYARIRSLALKLPFMPDLDNQRSMLYVGNLCEFIKMLLDNPKSGTYFPQNREFVNTKDMLRNIADAEGKKMRFFGLLGSLVRGLMSNNALVQKVFGNLVYDMSLSDTFDFKYCTTTFEDSFKD